MDDIEKTIVKKGRALVLSGLNYMVMLSSDEDKEDFKELSTVGLDIYKELMKLEGANNGY